MKLTMMDDMTIGELLLYLAISVPIWLALWWAFFYPLEKMLLASDKDLPRYLGITRRPRPK